MRTAQLALLTLIAACQPDAAPLTEEGALVTPQLDGKSDFAQTVTLHGALSWEAAVEGAFTQHFEFHRYTLNIATPSALRLEITQAGTSRDLDTSLFIFGPRAAEEDAGPLVAQDDNSGWGPHARLDLSGLPSGEYAVVVGTADALGKGRYRLALTCGAPGACEACVDADLGEAVGAPAATGSTVNGEDLTTGSCGFNPAPERRLRWRAPAAGLFEFDTFNSRFGTVLYLLSDDGACGGEELVCSNNASPGVYQSQLTRVFEAGESVIVVVDGYNARQGDFALNISGPFAPCPDLSLGEALGAVISEGLEAGWPSDLSGCGAGRLTRSYAWRAAASGRYRLRLRGEGALALEITDGCRGAPLACAEGGEVTLTLYQGQEIILHASGTEGIMTLEIEALEPDPAECPSHAALASTAAAGQRTLGYDTARAFMFSTLDNQGGQVQCVYTGEWVSARGIPPNEVMNTEHTWPKSRGADFSPARADLHHLFPTMSRANSARSSNPFGDVTSATDTFGPASLGWSADGRFVFEPRPEHKGDAARAMLYFSTRYDMRISAAEEATLRRWHLEDPVSAGERARNDGVEARQGNRNPFIDHPEWADCVADF
ncbi:endonuclease [Myxococcota bacterium]|nr:endonuclease [Myxococcota bacterium]MBU1900673.1 endonuclease [Myxococcota bacterium]